MTTSLHKGSHHSSNNILSHHKKDFTAHNDKSPSGKQAHASDFPDTFEYKDQDISKFLNQKRQELEKLNNRLASQNPGLYELVKQHEKEYVHSSSNSPFKGDIKDRMKEAEWLDRDAEREKRFKMREQEKLKQANEPIRKSDHGANLKLHGEITPKGKQTGAHKSPVHRVGDVKGRDSTQSNQGHQENYVGGKQGNIARSKTPVKGKFNSEKKQSYDTPAERKSLLVQGSAKDLNKRGKFDDKENHPVNVAARHAKKPVVRENKINISDIYEHHPVKREKESPMPNRSGNQDKSPSPNNPQKEENNSQVHQESRDVRPFDQSPQGFDNRNKESGGRGDQRMMKSGDLRSGEVSQFERSEYKEAPLYEKLQEDDMRRSQLRSQQMRKYSEDLKKQMAEHEEQKRREKQRKQEQEAREAEEEKKRIEEVLKKVERSSEKENDQDTSGSHSTVKGNQERQPSRNQGSKGSSDNLSPHSQQDQTMNSHSHSQVHRKDLYDFSSAATGVNIHDNRHDMGRMSHQHIERPGMSHNLRLSVPGQGHGGHSGLSQSMLDQRQLEAKLMEEKLKVDNLVLQEQLLIEQYKNKMKEFELEKMMHKQQQMLSSSSQPALMKKLSFPSEVSPITRKSSQMSGQSPFNSEHAKNFGVESHMVASMPLQPFGKHNHSHNHHHQPAFTVAGSQNHKQENKKHHDDEDDISAEADSLEQSFQDRSLPSTHYECQITKEQLNESFQRDVKIFQQLYSSSKENKKGQASHHKKPEKSPHKQEHKQEHGKDTSHKKKSKEDKDDFIYSIDNMGLMMTPETSETKKPEKKESGSYGRHDGSTNNKSPGNSNEEEDVCQEDNSFSEEADQGEQFESSDGFKQETAKFPVHKFDREEEGHDKHDKHDKYDKYDKKGYQSGNVKEESGKKQTPMKEKEIPDRDAKGYYRGSQEKGKTITLDNEKDSKSNLKHYLDLTTPHGTSSQRTSLSNKKYKSPKAIDPFSKRSEMTRSSNKEGGFSERMNEAMSTTDWKKRVHDLLQNKASKMSSSQKKKLQSITSTDDLKQAEKLVMEMEEEERCIEEYERQISNSSKKAALEDLGHSPHGQNNLRVSDKKEDYASSVKDEDQEEIEASEQTQRSWRRGPKEFDFNTRSNITSKRGTQRQTGQSWLENKQVKEEPDEDVVELETGNWEDLRWDLAQKGIIEEKSRKREEHEKRSQTILHKLEELLDGWTHEDAEKENSVRNGKNTK